MPTVCRLIKLSPTEAEALAAKPETLAQAVAAAKEHTGVYRYWHGIGHLLAEHRPSEPAAHFLSAGKEVSAGTKDIPGARLLTPAQTAALGSALKGIEPEALAEHYDAAALDKAGVYPRTWVAWEETFDPLGQMLEHYYYLKEFSEKRAAAGDAMLLYFEPYDDGSDA